MCIRDRYNVEDYWSDVAKRMDLRNTNRLVAGDSEPFYEYKRENFLKLLLANNFHNKSVLEVGCGPCLLYTSDAADERSSVDLGGRRNIKKKK